MPTDRRSKIQSLLQTKNSHALKCRPTFWKPARLIQRVTTSGTLQSWLTTQTSLTKRIRQHCEEMQVVVLSETMEIPLLDEANTLKMASNEQAWVRCVLLKCAHQNWVYARTVIPNFTPDSPWITLQKLGNKPLGEVLFEMPGVGRTPFEFSKQTLSNWPYLSQHIKDLSPQNKGYARRSGFTQDKAPLLLTEVFLDDLTNFITPNTL